MHQRLSIVGLGVADVAAATAFYARLGWTPSPASNPAITFFQAGGVIVSLFGRGDLLAEAGIADSAGADTVEADPLAVFVALESDRDTAIAISLVLVALSLVVLVVMRDRWWGRT